MILLPLVIIVLILVCAYLEYQKNINMNNKVVICIICILTFVLCMGFVDKNRNREEGFQNNDILYNDIKDKCDDNNPYIYGNSMPLIKKHIFKRDILIKYRDRLKNKEQECWQLDDYIKCEELENKSDNDLSEDEKKFKKTICKENEKIFSECIEEKMISKNKTEFTGISQEDIIKKATYWSIKTTDSSGNELDRETIINKIIQKEALRDVLRELRFNMHETKKNESEYVINRNTSGLCNKCDLDDDTCNKLKETTQQLNNNNKEDVSQAVKDAEDAAAEAKKAAEAANEANMYTVEDAEAANKATEAAEAATKAAEAANQALAEKEELEKENAELIKQLEEQITNVNSLDGSSVENDRDQTTTNLHNNIPYKMKTRLEARKQQRGHIYVNPLSSGHVTDKYYSSLDNKPPGYSYIDPRLWTVPQKRPPVCHYNNDLSAVPLYDSGTHINVLELTQYGDIATSERDVRQTNIGSILPQFQYREFN